tara:strand:+ start:2312 stop:2857 length:546 start_codon:yes stop_codon:yes gene_type:complete
MAGQRLTDKTALENHTGSGDLYMVVDVSDTTGSAEGTSKKIDSKFVIQTDKISVTSAEFQAMDATGGAGTFRTLANGPGAGYGFILLSAVVCGKYVSSTDSANKSLFVGYDSSSSTHYWGTAGRFMSGVTADRSYNMKYVASTTAMVDSGIDNKPLLLWSNGNFNGDFTADVYITYQVVQL